MSLGKLKQHTTFEVASFSRCRNIIGEPPNFSELRYPKATPTFFSGFDFMTAPPKTANITKDDVTFAVQ